MMTNLTINIEKEGLNKFNFIRRIENILENWKDDYFTARIITTDDGENEKYISFNFIIHYLDEGKYYYNFYYISNDSLQYEYTTTISKKEIGTLYNYLARDVDVIIKMYKDVNE